MVHGDDEGLVLPPYVAPTQIVIIPIQSQKPEVMAASNELFNSLKEAGYRVKLDDSNRTPGWKFAEYEMKGVPVRIEVGPRDLANGVVTITTRHNRAKSLVSKDDVIKTMPNILKTMHDDLYEKALKHVTANTFTALTYDAFKTQIEQGGYIKMSISGEEAELIIKADVQATARVILDEPLVTDICPVTGKKATQTILFARAY